MTTYASTNPADLSDVVARVDLVGAGEVAAFERNVVAQNALGVPSRVLDVAEARRLSPLISTDGLLAAAYSPDDGHRTPESVVLGHATAARRLGARLLTGTTVPGIVTSGGEIRAAATDRGVIATDAVIRAAGARSAEVGGFAGVDLPVTPLRRQVVVTGPVPGLPPVVPFTIDFASTFYFHREGPGPLMGMSDPEQEPGFHLNRSDGWLPRLAGAIGRRAPASLDVGATGGWAGLYEVTPDHNALIGGSRDLVLGRAPVVDVSAPDVSRFAAGLRPELNVA